MAWDVQEAFLFQFLYGTIKRMQNGGVRGIVYEFQFLYGTIKSIAGMCLPCVISISIPLWYNYKQAQGKISLAQTNFNSSMVQLKVDKAELSTDANKFQFLYGTIAAS